MVNTQDFATRTVLMERKNAPTGNVWGVAIDIGYSGVKGMSPNSVFCFPAFAKRINGTTIEVGNRSENDIQYRDASGVWYVGDAAYHAVRSDDTADSEFSLYGRSRYYSDMFRVLFRTGVALGSRTNSEGSPGSLPFAIQTGLPPAYLKSDAPELKDALAGDHKFEIRVGNGQWETFSFTLTEGDIKVMQQPMGSVLSACMDRDANFTPEAKRLLASNVLVFDAGFGTLDMFTIRSHQVESWESNDSLGMKAVLLRTIDLINETYHQVVPIHKFQMNLQSGKFLRTNKREHRSEYKEFADLLEKASRAVCDAAIDRVFSVYNALQDYDYFLVTGGTGAAWMEYIREGIGQLEHITLINGSGDDRLSHIFSNVRGYYLNMARSFQNAAKKSSK